MHLNFTCTVLEYTCHMNAYQDLETSKFNSSKNSTRCSQRSRFVLYSPAPERGACVFSTGRYGTASAYLSTPPRRLLRHKHRDGRHGRKVSSICAILSRARVVSARLLVRTATCRPMLSFLSFCSIPLRSFAQLCIPLIHLRYRTQRVSKFSKNRRQTGASSRS